MYVHVKVKPNAKKENVSDLRPGYLEISVREKAERGQANKRVMELLMIRFGTKNIRLINGHDSPSKLFSIGDM